MKSYQSRSFQGLHDYDSSAVFQDLEFVKCSFESCDLSITKKPKLRTIVKNTRLINCEVRGCSVRSAIIEDVIVDGLRTHNLLFVRAAVFNRVVLKGKIGSIMISGFTTFPEKVQEAFDKANAEYYQSVEWALDISEVECTELDIRGLPARFIRRDPSTQAVVKRANVLTNDWQSVTLSRPLWPTTIKLMLDGGHDDVVLVSPKRSKHFSDLVDDLKRLRDAGIAEPD